MERKEPKIKDIYETRNYIVKRFDVDKSGIKKFRKKKIITDDGREIILNLGIKNGKTILTSIWYNKNDFTKNEILQRSNKEIKKRKINKLKRKKKNNNLKRKIANMIKRKK